MADPLAIAGLVIALVQGGFQLYAGISDYLDAVEARSEELDFARRQTLEMRRSLEIIEQLAPKLAPKHAASSSSLESFLRSCELDIKTLNDMLLEFTATGPSGEGLRHRLHRAQVRAKKLTFPFNRSKIDRLEKRLALANGNLLTALNTANLEVSLGIQDHVSDVYHLLTAMVGANTIEARVMSSTPASSHQSRAIISSDSFDHNNALRQLVSKPGYLRSAIDELQSYSQQPVHTSWPLSDSICFCQPRRTLTRQRQVWSSVALSSEKLSSTIHNPDCQFAGATNTLQTFGMTLEYTGLRTLFQKAIQLSLHMTFGAGGLSINPGISYVPLVDHRSAPAFRLVQLLPRVRSDIPNSIDMIRIQKTNNNSMSKGIKTLTLLGVKKLIASKVPTMAHDNKGQSSAMMFLRELWYGDLGPMLATSLISAEPDETLFSALATNRHVSYFTNPAFFPRWPALAEAAAYGQLCSAVASGNQAAVSAILATTPSALRESNIFGQSPLHLAIHHPSCLKVLIKANGVDESLLNILDADSRSPLDRAMINSITGFHESTKILLEADCAVWQNDLHFFEATDDNWKPIIEAMLNRRERLKHLAMKVFSKEEIEACGLEENAVLDGNAATVYQLLLDKGIAVPQALIPVRPGFKARSYSMYHLIHHDEGQLEDLWTLGFRDINMLNNESIPPLMDWRYDPSDADYMPRYEWFINHGANVEEPVRRQGRLDVETQSITVGHNLFRLVGTIFLSEMISVAHWRGDGEILRNMKKDLESGRAVIEKLLRSTLDDACGCKCSRAGCTPFVWFLKYLPVLGEVWESDPWTNRLWPTESQPQRLADAMLLFTETFGSIMSQCHLSEALRCLTHTALKVKHTCCEAEVMRSPFMVSPLDPDNRQHMSTAEKEELESEQASLIDLLDSLVAEFELKSQEERDGTPLWRANPAEFWIQVWAAKMDSVLTDLDGADLTREEIRAAEDVGVNWQSPRPERPARERLPRRFYLSFEEFKDEVDQIMAGECS
ncbi:hypothetical protein PFICI_00486 [Pestalotiopsis fici W106-1]|uniref:Fungal N-terminal domain-containing protein n=1 Tax=Pestalotiopsis fici (strain W106-1 / CGMCC3.15140) TaxID=1229662 RepID=W3XKS2_PESFW|nr:uncharacterized protein PFICI_00486 [Pestalotiopsis fici W106-1]ETS86658.1 hypothetical protein PFICI_00486 [Pestalotiopsis fici W106-1]